MTDQADSTAADVTIWFETGEDATSEPGQPGIVTDTGLGDRARGQIAVDAGTISATITKVHDAVAAGLANRHDDNERKLARVEVELGLKVTAEGHAIVAKASAEANVTVRLVWEPK